MESKSMTLQGRVWKLQLFNIQGCRGNGNGNHIYPMGIPIVNPVGNPMGILGEIPWQSCGNSYGNPVGVPMAILWEFLWQSCGKSYGNPVGMG